MRRDLSRLAAAGAMLAIAATAFGQSPAGHGLGLCPAGSPALDSYTHALCSGEAALRAGDFGAAAERFGFAAALTRSQASNELAWAGLAAANCRSNDVEAGRQWAARFSQARRLWLGELDCSAAGDDPRAQLSPFVRSRMCIDRLPSDYAIVRGNPQAPHAIDLRARLKRIDDALASACSVGPAPPKQAASTDPARAEGGANKAPAAGAGRRRGGRARGRKAAGP